MTKREAAIVSAYTKILIGDMADMQMYIEEKAGSPVFTHSLPSVCELLHDEIKKDFCNIEVN